MDDERPVDLRLHTGIRAHLGVNTWYPQMYTSMFVSASPTGPADTPRITPGTSYTRLIDAPGVSVICRAPPRGRERRESRTAVLRRSEQTRFPSCE